jgi:hypothetical protein
MQQHWLELLWRMQAKEARQHYSQTGLSHPLPWKK